MPAFDVIALTPQASLDPALAIAGCRAGARGFLDLEYVADLDRALSSLQRLELHTSSSFGVKFGRTGGQLLPHLGSKRLAWVLLAGGDHPELAAWVAQLRKQQITILFEAVSLAEAELGLGLGVDGIVLKGQEAGGRVGKNSAFLLLQQWHQRQSVLETGPSFPVYVQGGIGLNTAVACAAAGAAGVVLDAQLLLARESPLSEAERRQLAVFDGSETICLGEHLGESYRIYSRPGLAAVGALRSEEERLFSRGKQPSALRDASRPNEWREAVQRSVEAGPESGVGLLGQDAALAKPLADRFGTVAGIIDAIRQRVREQLDVACRLKPLAEGAALAERHGTRFPIVQGPMTRVSDTANFAEAVAHAGALPFLALALLRKADTVKLLEETRAKLAGRPWGAGILGFAPPEVRKEQMEAILAVRPPFALIAGGRPDQARALEKEGIPTYLHVPSPGLLRMFLKDGARRFIFEGRECGGHVGPRTSFVLWETMCEVLLGEIRNPKSEIRTGTVNGEDLHILFAGGIHDALSASMVAALSAGLAERGAAVGVLLGTAYLFTQEAVATGAIVPRFQEEAVRCGETVLLETGPGHAIRCIPTPYAETFEQEKRRLQAEGHNAEEIREALEAMNIGRLRIASKGIDRASPVPVPLPVPVPEEALAATNNGQEIGHGQGHGFVKLTDADQLARGMYMIGQVANLRDRVVTMADLHADVSTGGTARLEVFATHRATDHGPQTTDPKPSDIAIIGMACLFPKAPDLRTYWHNILNRVDAITEIPASHWDWRLYYDANPKAPDKISSKWGGFLGDMAFDPLVYGMPPNSLTSIEPVQLLLLETVRRALADAGYADRPFNRERTAVVLGAGGGAAQLSMACGFRTYLKLLDHVPGLHESAADILAKAGKFLPEWTEDTFPGILVNVAAGRVSNRFNFGGPNFAVDAACGSSLAALYAGIRELESGGSDVAVVMGADTVQNPVTYMAFSKTQAFSPRGRCSTFDEAADGIVISEGVAVVILKRLADAERDGDRVYAVIKGVGASSDGKDRGLTAPHPEGQMRALRRAYAKAGVSPACVELVEAHGTGTVLGDQTEVQSLGQMFREAGAAQRSCAVGSVKSMIGHTKCAAGLAGLVNATLALHHKTLPPLLVQRPNSKASFEQSPFFLNASPRPWIHGDDKPRCAGVSAFGFGGTNFHAVLEEYIGGYLDGAVGGLSDWPTELFVWRKPTRAALVSAISDQVSAVSKNAADGHRQQLAELAAGLAEADSCQRASGLNPEAQPTLAIVAASLDELKEKLAYALDVLRTAKDRHHDPRGIFFAEKPGVAQTSEVSKSSEVCKVGFLFPGQGSQYPDMLAQLALAFPEVRQAFDHAERVLAKQLDRPLGKFIFPPSAFTPEQEEQNRQALTRTEIAQPAVGAASLGMFALLTRLGIEPDMFAGHSYGEYAALCAAGALTPDDLIFLSHRRGQVLQASGLVDPADSGGMAAIDADADAVGRVVADMASGGCAAPVAANLNSPQQTVISGSASTITAALERFEQRGIRGQRLPVACAFHSPLVASARAPLAESLRACQFAPPRKPVFANTTAQPHPADPAVIVEQLTEQVTAPVRFQAEIEAMYQAGARIFVEVGPQAVLTRLVGQILEGRPHVAVASDQKGRPGLTQLQHLLAQLVISGVPVRLGHLFERRVGIRNLESSPPANAGSSPSTWLVNSTRVRPLNGPEPATIGRPGASQEVGRSEPRALARGTPEPLADARGSDRPNLPRKGCEQGRSQPINTPTAKKPVTGDPQNGHAVEGNGHPERAGPFAGMPNINDTDEAARVMLRFQDLMANFLETQKSIMLTYLQGGGATSVPVVSQTQQSPRVSTVNGNGHPPTVEKAKPPLAAHTKLQAIEREPAQPQAAAVVGIDRHTLTTHLLEIVSKRTGYPAEMLGLDLDLEADLGIDSIKRVEILGSLADTNGHSALAVEMEKLTGIKTLRGIVDHLAPSRRRQPPERSQGADAPRSGTDREGIQRMLVRAVEAPLAERSAPQLPGGTILITDDARGVASELIRQLSQLGQTAIMLRQTRAGVNGQANVYHADLTEPRVVEDLLRSIREQAGPIAGLIHLLPLAEPPAGESWSERMRREMKPLFLLARGLGNELRHSEKAVFLAATAMGGCFGAGAAPLPDSFFPGQGGVAGLTKGLAHEWPEVLVRVVDVDVAEKPARLAAHLLAELSDADGPVEIGHTHGRRVTLECVPAPLTLTTDNAPPLTEQSTVLVTGGARGITAAVALHLAQRYRPNLVLVGRSTVPEGDEAADTAGLTKPAELKASLIARLRREGRSATPAAVESAYQRLLQDREIRTNIAALKQAGARVHYYQADVRDEWALGAVLEEIEQRFGGLDGVVHGAGVIQDKLVHDKTPQSYDRVFGTKVDSALILAERLRPERLRFCVFFASVAGRFGNRGQSDYAAANEVLTKLAAYLDQRWPGRVVSVAWGPWAGIGMVSELEEHLGQRGLQMIPPAVGPLFLDEELTHGSKGESEVVIAGDVGQLALSRPRVTAV
jgi:acyl transferase domain-containing protein/NAD(P)H-dependent flavin oxidoreductase YrpB (nitropropane dioxygenase family)/NAD(P)-dependent dehydrogenase (short-subunit alcohol dehydrogenase family)